MGPSRQEGRWRQARGRNGQRVVGEADDGTGARAEDGVREELRWLTDRNSREGESTERPESTVCCWLHPQGLAELGQVSRTPEICFPPHASSISGFRVFQD